MCVCHLAMLFVCMCYACEAIAGGTTTYYLLPTTYYLLSCYLLILTPTAPNHASSKRAWRLRAVPTFAESWSPVRSFREFIRSAAARHSPPKRCRGWFNRGAATPKMRAHVRKCEEI